MQDSKISVHLCEPKTFCLFKCEGMMLAFSLVVVACVGFLILLDFSLLATFCKINKLKLEIHYNTML